MLTTSRLFESRRERKIGIVEDVGIIKLLNDNRIDDLKKAITDESYREKLYEEYGL